MPRTNFTPHLRRYFPGLGSPDAEPGTVANIIRQLDARCPGLAAYVIDELGALRPHVNIFVDGTLVSDRAKLTDPVTSGAEVFTMQALSGG